LNDARRQPVFLLHQAKKNVGGFDTCMMIFCGNALRLEGGLLRSVGVAGEVHIASLIDR